AIDGRRSPTPNAIAPSPSWPPTQTDCQQQSPEPRARTAESRSSLAWYHLHHQSLHITRHLPFLCWLARSPLRSLIQVRPSHPVVVSGIFICRLCDLCWAFWSSGGCFWCTDGNNMCLCSSSGGSLVVFLAFGVLV
ncbi:hypothetical protein KC19_1G103400, partial [Ceratodon purpureus]